MANEQEIQKPKKNNKKKAILISIGAAIVTLGGILGFNYFKKKNTSGDSEEETTETTDTPATTTATNTSSVTTPSSFWKPTASSVSVFPLKKGSRGENVKQLQLSLIAKYGSSILPKYGADGDFGSEMEAALKSKGIPVSIDESTYNVLVKGGAPSYGDLAARLYKATIFKNFTDAIATLKEIRNVSDYSGVSEKYKTLFVGKYTLITGMLSAFSTASQKDAIQFEFLRMGLKYDGNQWSLAGINGECTIITIAPTYLYDPKCRFKIKVPQGMVLGYRLQEKDGLTLFRMLEKNKKLIVPTHTICNHA